ncbi:carboxylate--amine ligase [Trueperella pyogenes]|uniref:acetyl/propionyl/methylcrotonyl-CoA carboxylase subunit alpha n=1 Tax=Trueperella pyogenes TaxID=1661 RepID=UPI00043B10BD|nr:biotin carboxylase N-terminal domain-containing protein [Trueperella pyogenes]AHU89305.1 carboxylate--amine ligase [Trueperella pyogenes]OQD38401.1 carboxylate--amine ligase [Trueperella pyogenes]
MKILIANRSEIALRIIRTANDLGIETVVGYADDDYDAPFTHLAGQAYALGGSSYAETYMDGAKLVELAKRTGAHAVHPGYGFLSENAEFAQAVQEAGLTWIGPAPTTLRELGNKISARQLAERAGVQAVPGISEAIRGRGEVEEFVARWGYPIVTKKADGGGGRGITIIRNHADLDHFFLAVGEDLDGIFVEKFLESARHIETQCMRDSHGNFAVVSTRDCSVQRRNQKLIEEAPATGLSASQEQTLVAWSKALFDGSHFEGLGTCEFLVDGDDVFFLEVNPRLQVEHTVSEEVTGLDLVAEQIRIATGEPISAVPSPTGHSIEFRITCEDPARDMQPSEGTVTQLQWPLGHGVRIETGIAVGDVVTSAFDSMLAKIIVTGPNRQAAIARSARALSELRIAGIAIPAALYRDVLDDAVFRAGSFSTRWFEETFLPSWKDASSTAGLHASPLPGHAAPAAVERETFTIEIDGRMAELTVPKGLFAGASASPTLRPQPLRRVARSRAATVTECATGDVRSPIQAIVVRVVTQPGAAVTEGDLLVVLESMKMESYVYAPLDGVVESIAVEQGTNVAAGAPLLTITPNQPDAERKE